MVEKKFTLKDFLFLESRDTYQKSKKLVGSFGISKFAKETEKK